MPGFPPRTAWTRRVLLLALFGAGCTGTLNNDDPGTGAGGSPTGAGGTSGTGDGGQRHGVSRLQRRQTGSLAPSAPDDLRVQQHHSRSSG